MWIVIPKVAIDKVKCHAQNFAIAEGTPSAVIKGDSAAIKGNHEGYLEGIADCLGVDTYPLLAGYFERERELEEIRLQQQTEGKQNDD